MNSVNLQDTKPTCKNQLCFYKLTVNYIKKIFGKYTLRILSVLWAELNKLRKLS